jgi:prepilin-type processing-associated H-X9-DG protein
VDTSLELTIDGGAIHFEKFPYHLRDIHGRITCRNNDWQIHGLESRSPNGETLVTVAGNIQAADAGNRLQLTISGNAVPLDGELRQALGPGVQAIWDQLQPHGRADFSAHVVYQPVPGSVIAPNIRLTFAPHEQSVSIEPAFLTSPYRLEQLEGNFLYADGHVTMSDVRAHHGRVAIAGQGTWRPTAAGGWQLQLERVHADHLAASPDLLMALPGRLQKLVDGLQPNGTFRLHDSSFVVSKPNDSDANITLQWDAHLDCHQSDLKCGVKLEDISGSVHLVGRSDGQSGYTAGELSLDSLVWNDLQLTAIRGPLWIDQSSAGSVCYLGKHASELQQQAPRDISANAYGGSVVGNMHVRNQGVPNYQLNVSLAGMDLARFANERWHGRNDLTGTVSGKLSVSGTGNSTDALTAGGGELHVVDAHIYKLPVLVALLKVLQSRIPDTTAFNRCDADFTMVGQRIHFQQLNLLGDAVSFSGRGETSFDGRDLNLVFRTLVGRNQVPVLSPLLGRASEEILQIRVDGTLENPETHAEALPAVGQMIQQIQEELQPVVKPAGRAAESHLPFWPFRR